MGKLSRAGEPSKKKKLRYRAPEKIGDEKSHGPWEGRRKRRTLNVSAGV